MKNKGKRIRNKEEICEDWCFVCKDGGLLFVCDYKQCLKAYHAHCVGKDESFFDSRNHWSCKWHSCLICHKSSKFYCFCCPNAVCKRCITDAEFACVRGDKGFCNHCLKLALLSEEKEDVDSDGEKVDFKDRETYEGLFMEYWEIIKEQEGLTLENLRVANAQLKKGENFKSGSYLGKSEEDEDSPLRSDYEDRDDTEENKEVKNKKKSNIQQLVRKKRGVISKKREFIGWGSKSLIDFLASIGKDSSKELSQFEVHNIITGYINENKLFQSDKKKKILCDERLKSVLGKKTVNRNKIYELLKAHFVENLEPSDDEFEYSSDARDEDVFGCKKQKKLSICKKTQHKEEVLNALQSCFASITSENIKLVYLRRSLVKELLKQPETFECKVIGSFVRVKSEFIDFTQKNSHQLLEVTGMKRTPLGEIETEILLQVSNMSIDIGIDMLSDANFSEEECEDLRQKVENGLLRKLSTVELEHKARSLHKDIMNHWIDRELALLQNLIDRANEKGWRKELFEYLERKKLLQTPEERSRLLEMVPRVIAEVAEVEPTPNNAFKESEHEVQRLPKSILMGNSETRGDTLGGSGISSGDRAATDEDFDFSSANNGNGSGNALLMLGNIDESRIRVAKANEQNGCASIREVKQSLATETHILEQPCHICPKKLEKCSRVSVIVDQPSVPEKQNHSKDSGQKSMGIQEEPADQMIELSSDDDDDDIAIGKPKLEDLDTSVWHCLGPNEERKGPHDVAIGKPKLEDLDTSVWHCLGPNEERKGPHDVAIGKPKLEDLDTSVWHCLGPNEERKGPLSLPLLKRWSETSSFALRFKVWKTCEREESAISLSDAIRQFST